MFETLIVRRRDRKAGNRWSYLFVPQWCKFGPVELKVAHGRTEKGVTYLIFYVKHLALALIF